MTTASHTSDLRAFVSRIADQHLQSECDEDMDDYADYEGAYEQIVTEARALLTRLEAGAAEPQPFSSVVTLTAEEFDELERCMTEPQEPTPAVMRAAELLRKLSPAKAASPSPPQVSVAGGWRSIESAPRDGTRILVYLGTKYGVHVAYWHKWEADHHFGSGALWKTDYPHVPINVIEPTHWMPLPPPPQGQTPPSQTQQGPAPNLGPCPRCGITWPDCVGCEWPSCPLLKDNAR